MIVEYGNIKVKIRGFQWPTRKHFINWREDFSKLKGINDFQIYLHGRFLRHLKFGERTQDLDVLLLGNPENEEAIEYLLYEGTRLALEKYEIFVDLFWGSKKFTMVELCTQKQENFLYMPGNVFIVNGEIKKKYADAIQLRENLWKITRIFPTRKVIQQIKENKYTKAEPLWGVLT